MKTDYTIRLGARECVGMAQTAMWLALYYAVLGDAQSAYSAALLCNTYRALANRL